VVATLATNGVLGRICRERTAARKLAAEYFERFPKDRYRTEVESWREPRSQNIEFTMERLREPVEDGARHRPKADPQFGFCPLSGAE
jgi:hypothetical protein